MTAHDPLRPAILLRIPELLSCGRQRGVKNQQSTFSQIDL
jgi:hypothetical protein